MKKAIITTLGVLVVCMIFIRVALPTVLHKAGLHPEYTGPTYQIPAGQASAHDRH